MKSEDRKGVYAHGNGDVKIAPQTPGVNQLPDNSTAISRAALEDAMKTSDAARKASS